MIQGEDIEKANFNDGSQGHHQRNSKGLRVVVVYMAYFFFKKKCLLCDGLSSVLYIELLSKEGHSRVSESAPLFLK